MRVLLDTHALMWMLSEPDKLSPKAREIIRKPDNEVFISIINLWEIITKRQIGKLAYSINVTQIFREQAEANGLELIEFRLPHLATLELLPMHHRDPFDRALIAQALAEDLTIISRDAAFNRYAVTTLW